MSYDELELDGEGEADVTNTFLTFLVGAEEYAVPVGCVTEIVRLQKFFAIPDVPSYVRGVINLRGKVIPLVDVRARFGMTQSEYTDRTVVVVLQFGDASTGLIVDGVSEVAEIPRDQIAERPAIGGRGERTMVVGMGKRDSGVSFILDVQSVLEVVQEPAVTAIQVSEA